MQMEKENAEKKNIRKAKKIAVMSGKGGVGKTTIAVNIAVMLAKKGYRVGLLDADIDCPNVPNSMNIEDKIEMTESGLFAAPEKYGVRIASMALFEQEGPTLWRGPLIHKAIMQLIEKTDWGELDYLIIDMPPGTSDASLTIMQFVGIDAAVIVTTSQELSMMDATKSAKMAMQFHLPTGIIENMSGEVFGSGGGEAIAEELSLPFLGRVELSKSIRECCDSGVPAVVKGISTESFDLITRNIERKLFG